MILKASPVKTLQGDITLPGDKSISHRALILTAIADGRSTIHHFLNSADCKATLNAMRACGVNITHDEDHNRVTVDGVGLQGLQKPSQPIDCGNSGTTMRLLAGLLSAQRFESTLIGDASLSKRPMARIIDPLKRMGADITGVEVDHDQTAPLKINYSPQGGEGIKALAYTLPIASAQVKSCLLLASLYAQGDTFLVENKTSRDHTERLLQYMGADIQCDKGGIRLKPGKALKAHELFVPGDLSSAAFFIVGASMTPGSQIILRQVGINPSRMGVIHILRLMGADIQSHPVPNQGAEPMADLVITGRALQGITVPLDHVVSAMDEFPALFIAAACAQGETIIRGIQELRFKESDRIALMVEGLTQLGVPCMILRDGIVIRGVEQLRGGHIHCDHDHRIAMAFCMASLKSQGMITIDDAKVIDTSFPTFCTLGRQLGFDFKP